MSLGDLRRGVLQLWCLVCARRDAGPRRGRKVYSLQALEVVWARNYVQHQRNQQGMEKGNMSAHPSRRQILHSALASSSVALAIGFPALTFAQSAAPTPQCHDGDEATIRQTEGPYFKPSSPERADLVEPDTRARLVD